QQAIDQIGPALGVVLRQASSDPSQIDVVLSEGQQVAREHDLFQLSVADPAYGLGNCRLPFRPTQPTVGETDVARRFRRRRTFGFNSVDRDRAYLGDPGLAVAPPYDRLRHDETRPAGRVGWIEEEAAVRHQTSTCRRVVQLGGHFDVV